MNNPNRKPSMASLIDILKKDKGTEQSRDWQGLEDHVQEVYQTLLDLAGEQVIVARDVTIRGRNGLNHQIDVYYEFELTGLTHRVAIECKNMMRPVDKDRVLAFSAKVNDCPGVRGCLVSAHGYQSGAQKFAEDNGITLLTIDDLPSIGMLLGLRLEQVAIPSADTIGQPFWTLYELEEGAPYGTEQDGQRYGVLFLSKRQAQIFWKSELDGSSKWAIRGLSQENLRGYILTIDAMAGGFLIAREAILPDGRTIVLAVQELSRQELISEYYLAPIPIAEEPLILPSALKRKSGRG